MKLDHRHFNFTIITVAICMVGFLIKGGTVDLNSILGMLGSIAFNLGLFLSAAFGLQYFQLGTGRDIQQEIFDEHNIAASIYEGLLFLSIAIIIAKAF